LVQDLETGKAVFREDMLKVDFGKGPEPVSIGDVTVKRHGRPKALAGIGGRRARLFGETEQAEMERFAREGGFPEEALLGARPKLPAPAATAAAEVISRRQILQQISQKLELPIRVGRFRGKALGIYKVTPEVVRSKIAQDLPVIAHEVGHHINKVLWGTYERKTGVRLNWKPLTPFRAELKPIATKPRGGKSYLPEGFAEFVRMYLTDPAEAGAKAPRFLEFFEKELGRVPELRELLTETRNNIRRWIEQPAVARVVSQISKQQPKRLGFGLERLYTDAKDALRPIQRVVEEMNKGKDPLATEKNAYEVARLFAGWWGKADHFLRRGTFDADALYKEGRLRVTGKPLNEILKPVEGSLDNFRAYISSLRAIEKGKQGKETGISLSDAKEVARELESPEYRQAFEELKAYQNAVLDYLHKSDPKSLTAEALRVIRAANQDYVPFYRVFEESPVGAGAAAGRGLADLWSPIKRMKGSGREIIDPLESIVKNTYTFLNLAERKRIMRTLIEQAESTEGAGQWIERVQAKLRPTQFEINEIRKQLQAAGAELSQAELDATISVFRPFTAASPKEGIIVVGKDLYQVQPELYRALKGLDYESSNVLIRLLSMPARALRLGATALGPEFVIRNPLRDTMTAFMQSRYGFKPGVDTVRGLFHALKRDDLYWEWKAAGGEHAAMVSLDRTTLQSNLTDLMRTNLGWAVHHPIEAARIVSEMSEAASRLGEYQLARKAGATPLRAGFAAREVTLDFARMGAKGKAVNSIVAFFNAALEGTDKFVRVHLQNPKGTVAKAVAGITLPSILLYAINSRDTSEWRGTPRKEIFRQLPQWVKDFFWLVPSQYTPLAEATPYIPLPKPFLWGMVYASVPERVMEWVETRDPESFDELIQNVGTAALPGFIPTAAIPLIEIISNRSMFTGKRLEPRYMERIHPQFRAHPYTSEFSKIAAKVIWRVSLGKALRASNVEISPIKLDQAIFSITGGLGRAVLRGLDKVIGKAEAPTGKMSEIPILRAFAVRWPTGQAQSVRRFYGRLGELEEKFSTKRFEDKYPGRAPTAQRLTTKEAMELRRLRGYSRRMQSIYQQMRSAGVSKLAGKEKQRQIDRYMLQILELAGKAIGR
jgi:hypothetical protein